MAIFANLPGDNESYSYLRCALWTECTRGQITLPPGPKRFATASREQPRRMQFPLAAPCSYKRAGEAPHMATCDLVVSGGEFFCRLVIRLE